MLGVGNGGIEIKLGVKGRFDSDFGDGGNFG